MVLKAGIAIGDTLWEPSLARWFLAIKSEEGKSAIFSHWPKLDTLSANPGIDFAVVLDGGQS